jgi:hypothetical protein
VKRLIELPEIEYRKIRFRQTKGTMKQFIDEEGYLCYDEEEYRNWKPRKAGRKIKLKGE